MNPFSKLILLIFFSLADLLLTCNKSFCQNIDIKSAKSEDIFLARVKQFNEFADRFNFTSDFKGNPPDSVFRSKLTRDKMIASLFDLNDDRIQKSRKEYSRQFINTKSDFITDVIKNKKYIDKFSPGIIAEARSRVLIDGDPQIISILLNQEIIDGDKVKWVILDVKGDLTYVFKTDSSMIRFISPTSNETDFMNLNRALNDTGYLQYYAYREFRPDNLTLFFYLISTASIKFEYTVEVVYHILSIPGWYVKVRDFNRTEFNSGWLISDINKSNLPLKEFIEVF